MHEHYLVLFIPSRHSLPYRLYTSIMVLLCCGSKFEDKYFLRGGE